MNDLSVAVGRRAEKDVQHVWRDSRFGVKFERLVVHRSAKLTVRKQQCFAGEIFQAERSTLRQWAGFSDVHDKLLLEQNLRGKIRRIDDRPHQSHVDLAIEEGFIVPARKHFSVLELDGGKLLGVLHEHAADFFPQAGRHADSHKTRLSGSRKLHTVRNVLGLGHQHSSFTQERSAGIGQFDVTAIADEQRHAELVFQLTNLATERRHGDVQLLSGPGKA